MMGCDFLNILDAVIIICFIVGIMAGMRRGFIKEVVLLVGLILVLVISFWLRAPIATFMYKNLPFFTFSGKFQGVSVLNILLYEVIAFLLVFSVLYLVLRVLLKISGLIEGILKATIILGFFSKIGGAIIGFIESYVIVFVLLFLFSQPFMRITGIEDSKLADYILDSTPVMSGVISNVRGALDDVSELADKYKKDKTKFNEEAIKLFIKYDIITDENIQILREKGKL